MYLGKFSLLDCSCLVCCDVVQRASGFTIFAGLLLVQTIAIYGNGGELVLRVR